ncbi:MAG TPA: alkaline phosphatase D family protein [Bryobacteraceae bacterium]|nr:alkaline phosphatase D family protein [Bryobacteraceae bacterium]
MQKLNRRDLTRVALGAMAAPSALQAQAGGITHGPILGHVGMTEIHVWGRTAKPGEFRVRFGTNANRLEQTSGPVKTSFDHDNAAWTRLSGLRPDTKYYYRLAAGSNAEGEARHGGSFRTLPDPDAYRNRELNPKGLFNFRFEFGSCNNQKLGNGMGPGLPAFKVMREKLKDKVLFSILNGDWLYEEKREFSVEEWRQQVGCGAANLPAIVKLAPSITGVWENYKFFLERGVNMAAWHKEVPCYFTPDDHEILNDVYGTATAGNHNRRSVFRDIAMRAWFDYIAGSNPFETGQQTQFGYGRLQAGSDILLDEAADFTSLDRKEASNLHVHWGGQLAGVDQGKLDDDGHPNAGVYNIVSVVDRNRIRIQPAARMDSTSPYSIGRASYGKFRVGNVEIYLLDTRGLRDLHDARNPYKKGLSMLGRSQREWLIRSMKQSDADFFFLASSVNLMIPQVGTPGSAGPLEGKDDAWTAFVEERETLIKVWDSMNKPVIVMTGDLHNSFAIQVTGKVWEFCSGPHNSANHPARSEGDRPPNGPFDSRGRMCDIKWSTYFRNDVPAPLRRWPVYAVAQVNNVFLNPLERGASRWVAYPKPHLVIQYFDGVSGDLLYAESIHA